MFVKIKIGKAMLGAAYLKALLEYVAVKRSPEFFPEDSRNPITKSISYKWHLEEVRRRGIAEEAARRCTMTDRVRWNFLPYQS